MLFDLLNTFHVIGAAVLFATGLGTAFYMVMANRTGNITVIAKAVKRGESRLDFYRHRRHISTYYWTLDGVS